MAQLVYNNYGRQWRPGTPDTAGLHHTHGTNGTNGSAMPMGSVSTEPVLGQRASTAEEAKRDAEDPTPLSRKQRAWKSIVHWFDAYVVDTRPPTLLGGLLSLLVVPATIVYAVILYVTISQEPPSTTNLSKWTIADQPFTAVLRCGNNPSGCLVSNRFTDNPESGVCVVLGPLEETTVLMEFSYFPSDGLSVLSIPANEFSEIGGLRNRAYAGLSPRADEYGIHTFFWPFSAGTSIINYVQTMNTTLSGSAIYRDEWFTTNVDTDGSIKPGTTTCEPPAGTSGWLQARVRMSPQWNFVNVEKANGIADWFGTSCGMYAALISWGGLFVSTWEYWQEVTGRNG